MVERLLHGDLLVAGDAAGTVGAAGVTVVRRAGPIALPLSTLRAVRQLGPHEGFRRQVGSGGFFGYTGTFQSAKLGPVQMLATRGDGRVLLETRDAH